MQPPSGRMGICMNNRWDTKDGGQWKTWLLLPLCLLLCLGIYALSAYVSEKNFEKTVREVRAGTPSVREGAFAYNTLTAPEQRLYDAVATAAEAEKAETEIVPFVPTEAEYTRAMYALLCDRPELYHVNISACTLSVSTYSCGVSLAYYGEGALMEAEMDRVIESLLSGLPDRDYDRALLLHDRLCAAVTPADGGARGGSTAYDALVGGQADGFGYAAAYGLLCKEAGLSCRTVWGEAKGEGGYTAHAWNALTLGGVTGYTDVMWDDTPIAGDVLSMHGYYFLSGKEMSRDHKTEGDMDTADTVTYYEYTGNVVSDTSEEALTDALTGALVRARNSRMEAVEFLIQSDASEPDAAVLDTALAAALARANAAEGASPRLRSETYLYRVSDVRPAYTVRLFYEATDTTESQ